MLALAEILGLIVLNALLHTAFVRWKTARRVTRSKRTPLRRTAAHHYPQHPSPVAAFQFEAAPEHAAHVRPAGVDW